MNGLPKPPEGFEWIEDLEKRIALVNTNDERYNAVFLYTNGTFSHFVNTEHANDENRTYVLHDVVMAEDLQDGARLWEKVENWSREVLFQRARVHPDSTIEPAVRSMELERFRALVEWAFDDTPKSTVKHGAQDISPDELAHELRGQLDKLVQSSFTHVKVDKEPGFFSPAYYYLGLGPKPYHDTKKVLDDMPDKQLYRIYAGTAHPESAAKLHTVYEKGMEMLPDSYLYNLSRRDMRYMFDDWKTGHHALAKAEKEFEQRVQDRTHTLTGGIRRAFEKVRPAEYVDSAMPHERMEKAMTLRALLAWPEAAYFMAKEDTDSFIVVGSGYSVNHIAPHYKLGKDTSTINGVYFNDQRLCTTRLSAVDYVVAHEYTHRLNRVHRYDEEYPMHRMDMDTIREGKYGDPHPDINYIKAWQQVVRNWVGSQKYTGTFYPDVDKELRPLPEDAYETLRWEFKKNADAIPLLVTFEEGKGAVMKSEGFANTQKRKMDVPEALAGRSFKILLRHTSEDTFFVYPAEKAMTEDERRMVENAFNQNSSLHVGVDLLQLNMLINMVDKLHHAIALKVDSYDGVNKEAAQGKYFGVQDEWLAQSAFSHVFRDHSAVNEDMDARVQASIDILLFTITEPRISGVNLPIDTLRAGTERVRELIATYPESDKRGYLLAHMDAIVETVHSGPLESFQKSDELRDHFRRVTEGLMNEDRNTPTWRALDEVLEKIFEILLLDNPYDAQKRNIKFNLTAADVMLDVALKDFAHDEAWHKTLDAYRRELQEFIEHPPPEVGLLASKPPPEKTGALTRYMGKKKEDEKQSFADRVAAPNPYEERFR